MRYIFSLNEKVKPERPETEGLKFAHGYGKFYRSLIVGKK